MQANEKRSQGGRLRRWSLGALVSLAALTLPATALAASGGVSTGAQQTVPGDKAKLKRNGKAVPPANAPARVKRAIRAANRIDNKPYVWGGGHARWKSRGYDCSGAVSYVLGPRGARLIKRPMTSGDFSRWGRKGKGRWITVYGDSDHVFVVIAGLRFDTSQPDDGESGPGWSRNVKLGFRNVARKAARHKVGL